ncbi:hypothetical protein ACFTZI_23535 [Streptomyces decoyicus]
MIRRTPPYKASAKTATSATTIMANELRVVRVWEIVNGPSEI